VTRAIEIVSEPQFPLSELVTHEFTGENTSRAFNLVANYRDNIIKAVISF
jgi:hypothetical protein